jgi:D-glycero-alpha-D-manno-heptose-7-phosphate kinase
MNMFRTPLRVSFLGGGTDYPEFFMNHGSGLVLGSAIDKFSYIIASHFPSRLFDYCIRVSYRKVELVKSIDEIEHNVFREGLKLCKVFRDIELHNISDLPSFSGLGSSSTFTVGLLHALHEFNSHRVNSIDLAYEAIHLERNILHENVGCQDQTFAALGGLNLIEFRGLDDFRIIPLHLSANRLEELESHLLLVFTGITRKASDMAGRQLRNLPANISALAKIRALAEKGFSLLTSNKSIIEFGQLLDESWQMKRSLATDVSNPKIDDMYQIAREHGAVGGKLLGAGGGGFFLLFAPPDKHADLEKAFPHYEITRVKLNVPGSMRIY